jgi:hypothetical protein
MFDAAIYVETGRFQRILKTLIRVRASKELGAILETSNRKMKTE